MGVQRAARSHAAPAAVGNTGGYQRATDPWLSFSPNGRLHAITIGFDNSTPRNAILAAFSDNGGATWSTPRIVRFDNPRAVGNNFNDKETLTADPFNSSLVYATWQRIVSPSERASQKGYENAVQLVLGGVLRALDQRRRSHGSRRGAIFAERGRLTQTIGNQVEVLPDGTLINGFNLIHAITNRKGTRGYNVALVRSTDKGVTWSDDDLRQPPAGRRGDRSRRRPRRPHRRHPARLGGRPQQRTRPPAGTSTSSGWTRASTIPTTTTSCSRARRDGGLTWGAPVVVDQTPRGVDAFTRDGRRRLHGARRGVATTTSATTVPATPCCRPTSGSRTPTTEALTFPDESRLTTASFDMRTAPDALGYFVGDYTGLDHFGTTFHPTWVAANNGNLANRTDVFHRTAG